MPRRMAVIAALGLLPFAVPEGGEALPGQRRTKVARPPVTVTSPLSSDRLIAGESIVLSWTPLPDLATYPNLVEWEAFLSLDGGSTYPVRLTSHLDLDRRSIAVRVPEMPTREARLLLRFGDERDEIEYELPDLFEIRPSTQSDVEPARFARGRGESARDGDAGVAIWIEGSRDGRVAHPVIAASRGDEVGGIELRGLPRLPAVAPLPAPPQILPGEPSSHPLAELLSTSFHAPPAPPRAAAVEPRRTTCRQNE
jgi:hypothetical protein